jgi:hypothetical protein
MREPFKIGAKLLGLYQLFLTASSAIQLFVLRSSAVPVFPTLLLLLLLAALSLGLIFKTEWLASEVGADDPSEPAQISARSLLKAGIILIGLSFFLTRAYVIATVLFFAAAVPGFPGAQRPSQLVAQIALLLVSVFFVFGSEQIVQLLEKYGGWEANA